MRLSTRNTLTGTVVSLTQGEAMAVVKVELDGGSQVVTSAITNDAAGELGLQVGSRVTALVKATDVALGVE